VYKRQGRGHLNNRRLSINDVELKFQLLKM
jgi:hypothetical protein